jgi:hypothetical protein
VLGALLIEPLRLWINTQPELNGYGEIIVGGVFLLVVLFMPRGIIPTGREYLTKLRTRGRAAVSPATTIGSASSTPSAPPVNSGGAR